MLLRLFLSRLHQQSLVVPRNHEKAYKMFQKRLWINLRPPPPPKVGVVTPMVLQTFLANLASFWTSILKKALPTDGANWRNLN